MIKLISLLLLLGCNTEDFNSLVSTLYKANYYINCRVELGNLNDDLLEHNIITEQDALILNTQYFLVCNKGLFDDKENIKIHN